MHRIESYMTLALILMSIISILYLPILFHLKRKGKGMTRQMSYLFLFGSLFLIVFATILYIPIEFNGAHILNLEPFKWVEEISTTRMDRALAEVIPNILMFIPLGIFIPIVFSQKRKLYKTAFVVFLVTFSIEFLQYFIGRSSDIDDIIMNLLGGLIGYGIFKSGNWLFQKKIWWKKLLGLKV